MPGFSTTTVDGTVQPRYELKYLITEAKAAAIEAYISPFMLPDSHSENGYYPLVSLYLDSDDLQLCRESLEGVKNRFKLRIRTYSDEPDEPRYFEIKRRINRVIVKSRARVPDREVVALLKGMNRPWRNGSEEAGNLGQFFYYQQRINAKPVLRVRYLRQAFESASDDQVRITFDRHLSFNLTPTPTIRLYDDGWQRIPDYGVVLEIKFTGKHPRWLRLMTQIFDLKERSYSKYATMVKRACGLRFCAPRLPRRNGDGTIVVFS